ncbi:hypothetical protein [Maribacter flavus]|uniref:Uncharacterized protein n=1 Tax=Maribacter flavus TaxID=1658664 RepID=A0A5B2TVK8_9FLAO|nr:hypothetical protein [Maribacter flavus]KAA2218537.1 hypothetical protein F0361_02635 [Maribacter flavus]
MKEEEKDNYKKAFSTVITIFGGTATTALTGDPFSGMVLGNFLTEMLSMQSKVKQDRVFKFFELLERDLKILTDSYDLSKIDKTTTWDLVELAMVKASRNNNEERIKRLKNIIKNQIIEPTEFDYVEKFLNLAGSLTDSQVLVLGHFVESQKELNTLFKNLGELNTEKEKHTSQREDAFAKAKKLGEQDLPKIEKMYFDIQFDNNSKSVSENNQRVQNIFNERESILLNFNPDMKEFMEAELVSMGLIFNPSAGRISDTGEFKNNRPTGLAIKFIEYLKD